MEETSSTFIEIGQLRTGLFVQLDLGWMDHPFPVGNFKIATDEQIATIRTLGLARVRYLPEKSDPEALTALAQALGPATPAAGSAQAAPGAATVGGLRQQLQGDAAQRAVRRAQWAAQQLSLERCEQRFANAARQFRRVEQQARTAPAQAAADSRAMVGSCVGELLANGESVIRLLSEGAGDRAALHPINVMVVSLLLGKAMGMDEAALTDLGQAAVLHDLGKQDLPERVRHPDDQFTGTETRMYQEHVARGVALARAMGVSPAVQAAIAQHHEMVDGSGFPTRHQGPQLGTAGKVLALVNRYDNLCNPHRLANALTPHEALSLLFAQMKSRFDQQALGAFIRMMGVYPPGSVVQLVNDRYAMVVSVNSSRPLRPRVVVHDSAVPRDEALVLDLESMPEIGIRRSLKPQQLPRATLEYLSPRQRICYFFERAVEAGEAGVPA